MTKLGPQPRPGFDLSASCYVKPAIMRVLQQQINILQEALSCQASRNNISEINWPKSGVKKWNYNDARRHPLASLRCKSIWRPTLIYFSRKNTEAERCCRKGPEWTQKIPRTSHCQFQCQKIASLGLGETGRRCSKWAENAVLPRASQLKHFPQCKESMLTDSRASSLSSKEARGAIPVRSTFPWPGLYFLGVTAHFRVIMEPTSKFL